LSGSPTISSIFERVSSVIDVRFFITLTRRAYWILSFTILINSGKCHEYHSLKKNMNYVWINVWKTTKIWFIDYKFHFLHIYRFRDLCVYVREREGEREREHMNVNEYLILIAKVLISLSSWSSKEIAWMILLSALFTLNFTLARL
jgi:hypothetical protein